MIDLRINGVPADRATLDALDFAEWAPVALDCAPIADAASAQLLVGSDDLGPPRVTPFDPRWRWDWQPRGIAGWVTLRLRVERRAAPPLEAAWQLELRPRLLDHNAWETLLDDLARLARLTALAVGGAAFAHALLVPTRPTTRHGFEEAIALLEQHQQAAATLVRRLNRRADVELRQHTSEQSIDSAPLHAASLATPPARLIHDQAGRPLPATVRARQTVASADLPEHRWAVGLLAELQRRCRTTLAVVREEQPRAQAAWRHTLQDWESRLLRMTGLLQRLRATPPLEGLPPRTTQPAQSQRLARDPRYRPLRELWHELRATPLLTLECPELGLPLADLPTLYERWCALTMLAALAPFGAQPAPELLLAAGERWRLGLPTAQPLAHGMYQGTAWRLRYQPRYGRTPDAQGLVALDGYTRIPDLVLELQPADQPLRLIVLDAKYRRSSDGRPPQDALDDVYAYAATLGRAGASAVARAAVLYPHQAALSHVGSITVVPLLPGATAALDAFLTLVFDGAPPDANL